MMKSGLSLLGSVAVMGCASVDDRSELELGRAESALTTVSCDGAAGSASFNPPLTLLPTNVGLTGSIKLATCEGAGITNAAVDLQGTIIGGLCVPLLNTLVGAAAAGTFVNTWTGGLGPPTTTFNWTIPAGIQLGPKTSVIVLVGHSVSGRFHNVLTPALSQVTIQLENPMPACPGTADISVTSVSSLFVDAL